MNVFRSSIIMLLLVITGGLQSNSFAQFTGEINFLLLDLTSEEQATNLDLVFTDNRISIESSARLNIMPGLSTNSVLVRNDQADFLFRTAPREAYQIAKSDVDALVNLINRVQGREVSASNNGFNWSESVQETGNTRVIHGYEAKEFVLIPEGRNERISVWLTSGIRVNWGLLEETWHTTGAAQLDEEIPVELIMNSNSFPLLIEVSHNDIVTYRVESVSVKTSGFDINKTETASDTELLGLSDLMMNMIRQRR
ncbi:hypothetical protein [Rhodohalobacter mucosus]|uniref:DUF4412 domain-containing protein n=1 Tax=Rhodohalobacter mucosus TaxID=2079485 RepID=A0A316TV15_9BACT|nr:hypothetical protein [Rhodohalobacter mucosus]PWN07728.1 hypothetical protein DDZ15_01530 [Rhodohalobacter mucosus]